MKSWGFVHQTNNCLQVESRSIQLCRMTSRVSQNKAHVHEGILQTAKSRLLRHVIPSKKFGKIRLRLFSVGSQEIETNVYGRLREPGRRH